MIGAKLKALRQQAGLKQSYLAHKLGTSQTNVCEIENGHIHPTIDLLELYATFYGRESVTQTIEKLFDTKP